MLPIRFTKLSSRFRIWGAGGELWIIRLKQETSLEQ